MRKLVPWMVVALVVAACSAPKPLTPTTIDGSVRCANNLAVVGIWVKTDAAQASGWAKRTGGKSHAHNYYSFRLYDKNASYELHVGCGGTQEDWGSNNHSPQLTGTDNHLTCTPAEAVPTKKVGKCQIITSTPAR